MEVGKVVKRGEELFLFSFFFFCFSLLKTMEISFVSTKMGIFYREIKSGKMTLPTQKNMPVTPLHLERSVIKKQTNKQCMGDLFSDVRRGFVSGVRSM